MRRDEKCVLRFKTRELRGPKERVCWYKGTIERTKTQKLYKTKIKYWLDDFYLGSTDEYSQNSLFMAKSSELIRIETGNFFKLKMNSSKTKSKRGKKKY